MSGIAANAPVFAARMAPVAPNIYLRAIVIRFSLRVQIVTAFTNAQELAYSGFVARQWSAADTGGSTLTLTPPNAMLNSIADAAPQLSILVASASALTAGTRTLDANPFIYAAGAQVTSAASLNSAVPVIAEDYLINSDQEYPLNLQGTLTPWQSLGNGYGPEGLVIQNNVLLGAAGTVRMAVEMEWVEYNAQTAPGVVV
jgi:hypothetical protein